MNAKPFLHVFAAAGATFLFGCAAPAGDAEDDPLGTTSQALPRVAWKQLRKLGAGACKFEADAAGPADAFVITNGQDISIVFTRLGTETKLGPQGMRRWSRCNFTVPVEPPAGTYITGWHQSLQYGVVKPAGVAAGLGMEARLDLLPGGLLPLPGIEQRFPRDAALNNPLGVAEATDLTLDPANRPLHKQWRRQSCAKNRDRDVSFVGTAYTWTERTRPNAPPVILAVDGVDARFDIGATVATCPPNP